MAPDSDEDRPHLRGFAEFYQAEISPSLGAEEARRRRAVLRFWAIIAAASPGLIYWVYDYFAWLAERTLVEYDSGPLNSPLLEIVAVVGNLFTQLADPEDRMPGHWEGLLFLGVVFAVVWLAMRSYEALQRDVKAFLVERVCAFFGLDYDPRPTEARLAEFRACGLVPNFDAADLEDGFRGRHQGVALSMAEAVLRTKNSKGESRRVFSGVVIVMDFPKRFQGRTVVLRDRGLVRNRLTGMFRPDQRVRVEDPGFEKLFEVYAEDQVEARYLLTPTFQERAAALCRLVGAGSLQMAFDENVLLLCVRTSRNWFEAGGMMITQVDHWGRVRRMGEQIGIVFDIVDTLELILRTRI
jgi:hypothetical protein